MEYQASSPDEIAIVKWTQSVGITLISREQDCLSVRVADSDLTLTFDIIAIFPFTSEKKRMGIVLKDRRDGSVVFYSKGADSVMARLVQANDWLDEETGNMAREGLRTLVFARKKMSSKLVTEFVSRYNEAKRTILDRNVAINAVVAELLEHDLELLGLTGVEDKLQVGLPYHKFMIG